MKNPSQIMKHLKFEKLIEFFENSQPPDEARKISLHLKNCAECAGQMRRLENFFSYAPPTASEEVSQAATARLLNIFQPKKNSPARESVVSKLFGRLIFDDWQTATSERLAFSDTRQMLFRAGEFDVDLRFDLSGEKCLIAGQIFSDENLSGGAVEVSSAEKTWIASLNEFGEFVFPPLPAGNFTFRISVAETVFEIADVSFSY